jgi:hypothetical protein
MLDRHQVEAILTRRFPGATSEQVAAAVNAIMGLVKAYETGVEFDRERHGDSRWGPDGGAEPIAGQRHHDH